MKIYILKFGSHPGHLETLVFDESHTRYISSDDDKILINPDSTSLTEVVEIDVKGDDVLFERFKAWCQRNWLQRDKRKLKPADDKNAYNIINNNCAAMAMDVLNFFGFEMHKKIAHTNFELLYGLPLLTTITLPSAVMKAAKELSGASKILPKDIGNCLPVTTSAYRAELVKTAWKGQYEAIDFSISNRKWFIKQWLAEALFYSLFYGIIELLKSISYVINREFKIIDRILSFGRIVCMVIFGLANVGIVPIPIIPAFVSWLLALSSISFPPLGLVIIGTIEAIYLGAFITQAILAIFHYINTKANPHIPNKYNSSELPSFRDNVEKGVEYALFLIKWLAQVLFNILFYGFIKLVKSLENIFIKQVKIIHGSVRIACMAIFGLANVGILPIPIIPVVVSWLLALTGISFPPLGLAIIGTIVAAYLGIFIAKYLFQAISAIFHYTKVNPTNPYKYNLTPEQVARFEGDVAENVGLALFLINRAKDVELIPSTIANINDEIDDLKEGEIDEVHINGFKLATSNNPPLSAKRILDFSGLFKPIGVEPSSDDDSYDGPIIGGFQNGDPSLEDNNNIKSPFLGD